MAGQHALHQRLHRAAGGLVAMQTRADHPRVVEHQQIARLQQAGQIAEGAVHQRLGAAVEQARAAALRSGVLGDQLGGQCVIEVREREMATRIGHGLGHGLQAGPAWGWL